MQDAFESYHENATRVLLLVPDKVRERLHHVSASLDAVRAVRPGEPIDEINGRARKACDDMADTVRALVAADR